MKKSGKILGVLLAVCMVITMNVVSAYADSSVPDTKWNDYAATKLQAAPVPRMTHIELKMASSLPSLARMCGKEIPIKANTSVWRRTSI